MVNALWLHDGCKGIYFELCNMGMGSPEKETRERYLGNKKIGKENIRECQSTPMRKKTPTKTKEFRFATDSRIHKNPNLSSGNSEKPFAASLRERITSPNYNSRPTLPNPFKFMLRRKLFCIGDEQQTKWESLAEATLKFHASRFSNSPSEEDDTLVAEQIKTSRLRTTIPISPRLRTKERAQNKKTESAKDIEEKKVNEMKRFFNSPRKQDETLVAGRIQSPRVRTTTPISPKLRTKERARNKKTESAKDIEEKKVDEMKSYQFKAKEVNQTMIEMKGMYGVKEIPASSYTETKAFNFRLDQRLKSRKSEEGMPERRQDEGRKTCDSQKRKKFTPTKVRPFSFEDRDKERYMKKEERIKKYILAEEKFHEFHARSLPCNIERLPCVPVKKVTKQQPFRLSEGSQSYHTKLEEKLKLEEEEEKAKRQFRAQPSDVINKEPFQPIKGLISPTSPVSISLHSECRAKQRAEFEHTKEEKERNKVEIGIKLEEGRKLEEKEEIKTLRKTLVHKANPIRTFKGLEIHPSNVPVTIPQDPYLEVEKRAKSKLSYEITPDEVY